MNDPEDAASPSNGSASGSVLDGGLAIGNPEQARERAADPSPDMQRAQSSTLAFPAPSSRTTPAPLVPVNEDEVVLPGLVALGPVATERKARDWALVLQSMSIWHALRRSYAGWVVLVRDVDYGTAAPAIDNYEAENRDWPPRPVRERPRHMPSLVVPAMFVAMVAFFIVTGPVAHQSRWFDRGIAVSSLVLSSQPWRAVTALTLHADAAHVIGNAISGTVFASAVQRRIGAGGAALAVLASGILGNVVNAVYYAMTGHGDHRSLGGSTAVFGAVGLLAATQLVLDRPDAAAKRRWISIAAPLVGGLALLGALGASPNSDLGAHLFGFLGGVIIGLVAAWPLRKRTLAIDIAGPGASHAVQLGSGKPNVYLQAILGAVAAAIVLGSWQLAMRR